MLDSWVLAKQGTHMLKKVSTVAIMQSEAFRDHGHEENWPTEALEELGFIVELLLILCTKQVVSATLLPLTAYLVNDHCDVHREVDQRIQCIEVQHDLQRQTRRHVITLIFASERTSNEVRERLAMAANPDWHRSHFDSRSIRSCFAPPRWGLALWVGSPSPHGQRMPRRGTHLNAVLLTSTWKPKQPALIEIAKSKRNGWECAVFAKVQGASAVDLLRLCSCVRPQQWSDVLTFPSAACVPW